MKKIFMLSLSFLFVSCANYVNNLHRQIDREERKASGRPAPQAKRTPPPALMPDMQGQQFIPPYPTSRYDKRPIQNPATLQNIPQVTGGNINQNGNPNHILDTSRRRYTAEDLRDNDSSGSLWGENNGGTYLFTTNENIKRGDFVVIEVLETLKDEIQDELKRAFPEPRKKLAESEEKASAENATQAPAQEKNSEKVYDKISTQVVDEVNQNYLFVRGRKEVVFRGAKRFIEIQAVVPRKDIQNTDSIRSDKILQPRIFALRY